LSTTQSVFFFIGIGSTVLFSLILLILFFYIIYDKNYITTKLKTLLKDNKEGFKECSQIKSVKTEFLPETKEQCTCYFNHTRKLLGCTDHNKNIISKTIKDTN